MKLFKQWLFLLNLAGSKNIVRRYFVVNGFDGALTMLGLIFGFLLNNPADLSIVINVCLGAAIALGMSGVSSAYVSESVEQQRALSKLEGAMIRDLQDSAHGKAARWTPIAVALVNGSAPLFISLIILSPLWASQAGLSSPLYPLHSAIIIAMALIFLLGVFLGRIAGVSWIRSGIQTLFVAAMTAALIYFFAA
jgi:predicted membrane protein (TIGR00267 family)